MQMLTRLIREAAEKTTFYQMTNSKPTRRLGYFWLRVTAAIVRTPVANWRTRSYDKRLGSAIYR